MILLRICPLKNKPRLVYSIYTFNNNMPAGVVTLDFEHIQFLQTLLIIWHHTFKSLKSHWHNVYSRKHYRNKGDLTVCVFFKNIIQHKCIQNVRNIKSTPLYCNAANLQIYRLLSLYSIKRSQCDTSILVTSSHDMNSQVTVHQT